MKKSELQNLRKYAGDLSGIYGMQDFTYNEGRAKGLRAIQLKNGRGLEATLLPDRCLDVPYFSYKGINLGLVTKVGLSAPTYYTEDGVRGFLKQFNAGLLTTCGLTHSGAPSEIEGRKYSLHGVIGNTPCVSVNKEEVCEDDAISLQVSGEVQEACVFGEYVVMNRKMKMETESNILHIIDTIENRDFAPVPLMNLYHINFGYPLLDAGCRIYFSTEKVEPKDDFARQGLSRYSHVEEPEIGMDEQCYIHTGGTGHQFALLHNPKLSLAAVVHYDIDDLPFFNEWKCMKAGDYALGLEPSAAGFWGLEYARDNNIVQYLQSGESITYHISIEILDDEEKIQSYISQCKESK
ncbi:MAG: DUF4432 family protein [Caldicoprobacterales bacterium]|jgi:hypothetical protein